MAKPRSVQPGASSPHPVPSATSSSVDRQEQIARRAYELYVARGYRQGCDLDDWLEAEQEIGRAA